MGVRDVVGVQERGGHGGQCEGDSDARGRDRDLQRHDIV